MSKQTGDSKLQLTNDINVKKQEQNSDNHEIQLDLDRPCEHWQEKKTYPPFKDNFKDDQRSNSLIQSDKSSLSKASIAS